MRRLLAWPVRLSLLTGLLVSCGDEEEAPSFAALAAQRDVQIDVICGCSDELGWDSRSECKKEQDPILASKRDCADKALALDPVVAREYLRCYEELERNYSECIDDQLECDDAESIQVCADDYRVGAKECVELSNRVENALEDCEVTANSLAIKANGGGGNLCSDTCEEPEANRDGVCDDGGPGSEYNVCDLGTDCTDCGPR